MCGKIEKKFLSIFFRNFYHVEGRKTTSTEEEEDESVGQAIATLRRKRRRNSHRYTCKEVWGRRRIVLRCKARVSDRKGDQEKTEEEGRQETKAETRRGSNGEAIPVIQHVSGTIAESLAIFGTQKSG